MAVLTVVFPLREESVDPGFGGGCNFSDEYDYKYCYMPNLRFEYDPNIGTIINDSGFSDTHGMSIIDTGCFLSNRIEKSSYCKIKSHKYFKVKKLDNERIFFHYFFSKKRK